MVVQVDLQHTEANGRHGGRDRGGDNTAVSGWRNESPRCCAGIGVWLCNAHRDEGTIALTRTVGSILHGTILNY